MAHVIFAAFPFLQARDEFGEQFIEWLLRRIPQFLGWQQSKEFFLICLHKLAEFGLRDVFDFRVQWHVVNFDLVADAIPAPINATSLLFGNARTLMGLNWVFADVCPTNSRSFFALASDADRSPCDKARTESALFMTVAPKSAFNERKWAIFISRETRRNFLPPVPLAKRLN
jgi:hypothetical protein